jgi:hypothetical protein
VGLAHSGNNLSGNREERDDNLSVLFASHRRRRPLLRVTDLAHDGVVLGGAWFGCEIAPLDGFRGGAGWLRCRWGGQGVVAGWVSLLVSVIADRALVSLLVMPIMVRRMVVMRCSRAARIPRAILPARVG